MSEIEEIVWLDDHDRENYNASFSMDAKRYAYCPPGYRVVKEEPTPEMVTAVLASQTRYPEADWNLMLVASPKPGEG